MLHEDLHVEILETLAVAAIRFKIGPSVYDYLRVAEVVLIFETMTLNIVKKWSGSEYQVLNF